MALRGSPFRSPGTKTLVLETPTKQSAMRSPLKGILRTPVKAAGESSGLHLLNNPLSRTPRKSVTWSPSPRKCRLPENVATFKVPESPCAASRCSPRLMKTPNKFSSPSTDKQTDILKTPEKTSRKALTFTCQINLLRISPNANSDALTPEKDLMSSERLDTSPLEDHHLSPKPSSKAQIRTPSPVHLMITRSGRTPGKGSNIPSPCKPGVSSVGGTSVSEGSRTRSGAKTSRHNLRSQSGEEVPSQLNCDLVEKNVESDTKEELKTEAEANASSHTDSQQFDSSQTNSASDNDSMDIVDASVVKTQFSGGLKMNISFSRKPSKSSEDFLQDTASPKPRGSPQGIPGRSYGFRQTPDRQQREAAARLGYANDPPRFSTPRGPSRLTRQKSVGTPKSASYQVEMEMQTSGLPKLKIKRTDSIDAGDVASDGSPRLGARSPLVGVKPSQLESPLALRCKPRDCVSPSVCAHVTPAKSTPGKGGIVQTYICQSYTPTRHPAGTMSPVANADVISLSPSPQSVGKVAPDNLNSWPRRKRAQIGVVGGKDRCLKEPLLEELLEEAELGVSRLQDVEDNDEHPSKNSVALVLSSKQSSPVGADGSVLSPAADLYWTEQLAEQADYTDPHGAEEEMIWTTGDGDVKSGEV